MGEPEGALKPFITISSFYGKEDNLPAVADLPDMMKWL